MITKLSSLVKMAEAWNSCHTLVQPDGGKYLLMASLGTIPHNHVKDSVLTQFLMFVN